MDKRIQLKRSKNILESRDAAFAKVAELSGVTIDGEPVAFQYLDNGNVETILAIKAQKNEDRGVMVLFDSANKDLWNAIDEKLSADDLKTVNGTSLVGHGNVDANDVVYFKKLADETLHETTWDTASRQWVVNVLKIMPITDGKLYLDVDSHVLYWATDQLHEIFDLSDFYNKEEVNNLLDDKLDVSAYTPVDLSNYYDRGETDALLDNKLDVSAYTPVDLSNYYNKDETDALLDDKVDKTTFNRFSGDTVRDLYSLHQDKLDVSAYTPVDLTNYYDKDETDNLLDNKLDVSAYTQTEDVVFGTLLDDGFHTGEWVESHGNEEFIPDREVVEPSDSKIYVDVVENKVYRWRRQYYEISGSGDMSEYVQKTIFNILSGNVDDNKAELDAAEVSVFGVDTDASLRDASAFYSASTLLSGSTSMVEADMTLASSISAITGELNEKVDVADLKTVNGESIVGSGNIDAENVVLGKLVKGSGEFPSEYFYKFLGTYSYSNGPVHDIESPDFSDTAEIPDVNKTYVDILTKKAYWYDGNPSLMSNRFKELSVADLSNYYNKTEIDEALSGKAGNMMIVEVEVDKSGGTADAGDITYEDIASAIDSGSIVMLKNGRNLYRLTAYNSSYAEFTLDSLGNAPSSGLIEKIRATSSSFTYKTYNDLKYIPMNSENTFENMTKPGWYANIEYISYDADLNGDRIADGQDIAFIADVIMNDEAALPGHGYYDSDDVFHEYQTMQDLIDRVNDVLKPGTAYSEINVKIITEYIDLLQSDSDKKILRFKSVNDTGVAQVYEFDSYSLFPGSGIKITDDSLYGNIISVGNIYCGTYDGDTGSNGGNSSSNNGE